MGIERRSEIHVLCALLYILLIIGCASMQKEEKVIAVIDGEPITMGDLEYELQVVHRRQISDARDLDISGFIHKLISDRLIVQEARRMGLEDEPEIIDKVDAYILRESVTKLYDDEIKRKVSVSEEVIIQYYKKNYKGAPDNGLEEVRAQVENIIKNEKVKERSKEYLNQLYGKAQPEINQDILSSISLNMSKDERKDWMNDERQLVKVYDSILTAGNFVRMLPPRMPDIESKIKIIDRWIHRKLVGHEALSRHYETDENTRKMIARYRNQLVKNAFIQKYIRPEIKISRSDMEEYYINHQDSFTRPVRYKFRQITVKTEDEAKDVLNNLHKGADFSWLAKSKSIDNYGPHGGSVGFRSRTRLTKPIREIVDSLKPGEISPIIKDASFYRIIRLEEKSEGEVEPFNKIAPLVHRKLFRERIDDLYNSYVERLKKDAHIVIHNDVVALIENIFKK